jgi:poly(3-hydroxybutyrate) depolymerase
MFQCLLFCWPFLISAATGCVSSWPIANSTWRNITVVEDGGNEVKRRFVYTLPERRTTERIPVLFVIHGQTLFADDYAKSFEFDETATSDGVAVIFPQGMDDGNQGTGWNVGSGADNTTCSPRINNSSTDCYRSCTACGRCDWSTCHDDVKFIHTILGELQKDACIDIDRVFIFGESNGGMFVHHLLTALPGAFLGAVPVYGLPLLGYINGADFGAIRNPQAVARTSVFALHDRQDVTIPLAGGESEDGWLFEPLEKVMGLYAALHLCSNEVKEREPWVPDPSLRLRCYEQQGCQHGRVRWCMYDGHHGDWPRKPQTIAWHFFKTLMADGIALSSPGMILM